MKRRQPVHFLRRASQTCGSASVEPSVSSPGYPLGTEKDFLSRRGRAWLWGNLVLTNGMRRLFVGKWGRPHKGEGLAKKPSLPPISRMGDSEISDESSCANYMASFIEIPILLKSDPQPSAWDFALLLRQRRKFASSIEESIPRPRVLVDRR